MRKCKKCKYYKDFPNKGWTCAMDLREMPVPCMIRNILGAFRSTATNQEQAKSFLKKAEKIIDDANKDINEGEEWKNK